MDKVRGWTENTVWGERGGGVGLLAVKNRMIVVVEYFSPISETEFNAFLLIFPIRTTDTPMVQ